MHQKHRSPGGRVSPSGTPSPSERVAEIVRSWKGVRVAEHRFGGLGFTFRGGELGHFHNELVLDLPFPGDVGQRLVAKGWADPNHLFPSSGWVTFRVEGPADIAHAVRLLRIAYRYRRLRIAKFKVY